jgi:hypothetical protein
MPPSDDRRGLRRHDAVGHNTPELLDSSRWTVGVASPGEGHDRSCMPWCRLRSRSGGTRGRGPNLVEQSKPALATVAWRIETPFPVY